MDFPKVRFSLANFQLQLTYPSHLRVSTTRLFPGDLQSFMQHVPKPSSSTTSTSVKPNVRIAHCRPMQKMRLQRSSQMLITTSGTHFIDFY
jgi:hypothetical protein